MGVPLANVPPDQIVVQARLALQYIWKFNLMNFIDNFRDEVNQEVKVLLDTERPITDPLLIEITAKWRARLYIKIPEGETESHVFGCFLNQLIEEEQ